ncbi:Hypothetical predicted protein, partial [Mytilus galloprovincialis]
VPINTTLTLQPEHPFVGDNITLTCSSTIQRWPKGYGTSHLSYQFHGNTRGATDNNELQIQKLIKSDKGTSIKCQATDDLRKVSNMSNTVTLDPFYGPENVVVEPEIRYINVTEGTTLGPIHCIAKCNPECRYNWNQNISGNFEPVKNKFISKNNQSVHMHVPTITRNQAGTYRCRVDHPVVKGRSKIKDIIVNVQSPPTKPTITLRPNNPFVGDNISLTCKSTAQRWPGNIPAHLLYQFIGNNRGEFNNNRLIMNNLTKLDKGTNITCQATDDLGKVSKISKTVILDPYYGPENVVVKPAIRSLNVTEGSALGPIHCIANCNPECQYIWKQQMTGNFHPVKNEFISNNSVHVPTITRNQSGTYRCLVDHPEANNRTKIKNISVNVQYSPKITEIWLSSNNESSGLSTPITYNFNEEVIVKMTLRIESNPDPQILFNSSLLKFKIINIKINGYIDYISNLPSLKCEDSGNYQILARNGIPYADTRTVSLKIYCKPRNATAESGTIGTKVGTEESIVLNFISFPAPNVTWLRVTSFKWTILKERYDYKHKINSKIHIRTEEDFGVYGIKICNQFGCIVENITLKPQDKPETPKNFSVETATFRSLNISWIAGFNGGHEQTFSVHYKATDDFKWDKRNVQTSNIRTGSTVYYTLDQLKPDTSYQVTVVSKNIHGQRNASLEFKTEDMPEAPQYFSVGLVTDKSVILSWIAGFNGGHQKTFSVQFKTTDDDKWDVHTVHNDRTRMGSTVYYKLDQLKPDTRYQVMVLSRNIHGHRDTSLEFKTKVEYPGKSTSKTTSISTLSIVLACGYPVLFAVIIVLLVVINRRNKSSTGGSNPTNINSTTSDEYTVIQRGNPTFTEPYSTLQSPTESTALRADSIETDTYDECGIITDIEVNQTIDNRKSGNSKDEHESGKENTKERMYANMKI